MPPHQVGHSAVKDGCNGGEDRLFHIGFFVNDHMLALLEAVINMGQLECIGTQSSFKEQQLLDLAHGNVGPLDLGCHVVVGKAAGLAVLNAHDPVLAFVQIHQIIYIIGCQGRYSGPVGSILGSFFQILLAR